MLLYQSRLTLKLSSFDPPLIARYTAAAAAAAAEVATVIPAKMH